ncbi:hypothetical protein OE88DRAFT_1661039 [Heliocybe sulcata]|uniref:C2H2-type domain-containing protein n=1 Tax=Heliocybe sulcata TaxID=5364 RepID=A0A5C3N062_9AGAM|nr:hypothetical protein OE88DRAFT_1661039 [Heliocybe sulcata]
MGRPNDRDRPDNHDRRNDHDRERNGRDGGRNDRERGHDRERDKERTRERDRERDRAHDRERDRGHEHDRERDRGREPDYDRERARRQIATSAPPGHPVPANVAWHNTIQTNWELSFSQQQSGQLPTVPRVETPALLYDPTVFDVVLVPHPLVGSIARMVNEYMQARAPTYHPEALRDRYQSQRKERESASAHPLQSQPNRGNRLADARLDPRPQPQQVPYYPYPSVSSARPIPQRIPPPVPPYFHDDIENIRPSSQPRAPHPPHHRQPPPPYHLPRIQPAPPPPPPPRPQPQLQPYPQYQHLPPQVPPNRQYYRPSAWPNGRSFMPQDAPSLPTPRLQSIADHRDSISPDRASSPMPLDDESNEEHDEPPISAEPASPKSPYYNTEGESEISEDVDQLEEDDDDGGNGRGGPSVRRRAPARRGGKKGRARGGRAAATASSVVRAQPSRPALARAPASASASAAAPAPAGPAALNLEPSVAEPTPADDMAVIMYGERPARNASASASPAGSGAASPRTASPSEDGDVAMSDPSANLPPRARRKKRPRRSTRKPDREEPAPKRARPSDPGEGPSNADAAQEGSSTSVMNLNTHEATCIWPLPFHEDHPLDMRRRLAEGTYQLCNQTLNLRRQNESKKHIVNHILVLKGRGLVGEHIKCPWPDCAQYAKLENLARHISHVHLHLNFTCRFCGKSLARKDALKRHCASQHPNMIHGDFPLDDDAEDEPDDGPSMEAAQEASVTEEEGAAEEQGEQEGAIQVQAESEEAVQDHSHEAEVPQAQAVGMEVATEQAAPEEGQRTEVPHPHQATPVQFSQGEIARVQAVLEALARAHQQQQYAQLQAQQAQVPQAQAPPAPTPPPPPPQQQPGDTNHDDAAPMDTAA